MRVISVQMNLMRTNLILSILIFFIIIICSYQHAFFTFQYVSMGYCMFLNITENTFTVFQP